MRRCAPGSTKKRVIKCEPVGKLLVILDRNNKKLSHGRRREILLDFRGTPMKEYNGKKGVELI